MKQLEKKYRQLLESIRSDRDLLSAYSYKASTDDTGNQAARKKLLVSLLNFKEESDYEIASYLFDEEMKAKHNFASIDDYNIDILELSVLVLISFDHPEDILRMEDDRPNADGELVLVNPDFYALYGGSQECHRFLSDSADPRAKLALDKLKNCENFDQSDVESLKYDYYGYFDELLFPLESVIDFCILMKEVAVLDQEANEWIDNVVIWGDSNIRKGQKIQEMIDNPSFSERMTHKKEQHVKSEQKFESEKKSDDAAKHADAAVVFLLLILFIGVVMVSVVAVVVSLELKEISQIITAWVISLGAIVASSFPFRWLQAANDPEPKHYEKIYLSRERAPKLSWEYSSHESLIRWNSYTQGMFAKIKRKQIIGLVVYIVVAIGFCIYIDDPVLIVMVIWLTCFITVMFFMNFYKKHLIKRQAYLHTKPAIVELYDRGMVIGKKHYVTFNTNSVWLRGIELIEKDGVPFLQIETNPRGGEHPDANIIYHIVPIPQEKEEEARDYYGH